MKVLTVLSGYDLHLNLIQVQKEEGNNIQEIQVTRES